LDPVTIATQSPATNFTRATAPEVVAIGRGVPRQATERHWDVTQNSEDDWDWTITTGAGTHQGYIRNSSVPAEKRFGTNRLADPNPNSFGDPSDPGALEYGDMFEAVISDTTAVLGLETPDGVTRDIISMMTVFDNQTAPGSTELEFQGTGGNSGSGVFFKRGGNWELAGIINAIFLYPSQNSNWSVYGNSTLISDLSYYNQNYPDSIKDIIQSHPHYSHLGDLNLDGTVEGDGSGPPGLDDVTDFVLGWGYDNGTGQGTITSWKNGDLTHDGKTNIQDFLVLRSALNGQISSSVMEALFGSGTFGPGNGAIPEPATALLASIAAAWLALVRRRHVSIS
jgi:hypothetical protein